MGIRARPPCGAWLFAALVTGCASASSLPDEPDPPPIAVVEVERPEQLAETSSWPPASPHVGRVACHVRTRDERLLLPRIALRVAPAATPFADLLGKRVAQAELSIPIGSPGSALLQASNPHASIEGWVDVDELPLRPAEPIWLEHYVVLKSSAALKWTRAQPGKLAIEHPLELGLSSATVARAAVSCKALTLGRAAFDAVAPLLHGEPGQRLRLKPGRYPLERTPSGPQLVELSLNNGPAVWLLEERGGKLRIAWERQRDVLVGWVPARAADRGSLTVVAHKTARPVRASAHLEPPTKPCPGSLALVVGQDQRATTIGMLRTADGLRIEKRHEERVDVRVAQLPAAPRAGVELWVREDELLSCKRAQQASDESKDTGNGSGVGSTGER